ncbi:ADP-ribosylation factor-like protein 2-binding protein [Perognathus longimembris pacificus]|uniref:ADP-ribosylation factor-like protein 2-binding protein n=1 Tax=Perognathus longimembris pacificus TaxID=214514 RepID=UPI0020195D63|nr:ADP-ribosylation factor-like protein 2-binding protein [Perognathus longimembris pacificus]
MEALEEEIFALSASSSSDAEFDAVVGSIEDIIMDAKFQELQRSFMDKYYQEFKDSEEDKTTYTSVFHEYLSVIEKYIEEELLKRIPKFNMAAFTSTLSSHEEEITDDILDMLLTFTDILAFKEMFLDYQAEKEGRGLDLSSDLVVTSLCKTLTKPTLQNDLEH